MQVNIQAVVDDLKNVSVKNVIFEALANAIQAKATEINVKIYTNDLIKDNQTQYIEKMAIIDNGEGFIEANLKSFE